jgi:hypothetical protein
MTIIQARENIQWNQSRYHLCAPITYDASQPSNT